MVLTAFSTARSPRTRTVNLLTLETLRHKTNTIFKTLIFCLRAAKKGDGLTNRVAYYRQFVSTLFRCKSNLTQKPDWVKKIWDLIPLNPVWTQDLLKIRDGKCEAHQQRGWGAVAADCGVSRFSDGCELVWGQGTELPLCVSPDCVAEWLGYVAVVTKINYSRWKTFLRFPFFFLFFSHSLHFCTPLFLFSFFFSGTGCDPNVCHTGGRGWKGEGSLFENISGVRSCPPQCSQVRQCVLKRKMPSVNRFTHTDSKTPLS